MAVHIRLIRNNIKRSSSYGKYFAKTVSQGEVTLDEIAAEACRNSGPDGRLVYDFAKRVKVVWAKGFDR